MGRKRNPTGYFFSPGSQFREAELYFNLRSCLHYTMLKYDPRIGNYINKHGLYRRCPPRILKGINMNELDNASYVINVSTMTSLLKIEIEKWGANSNLRKVNDEVYICTC